MKRPVVAVGIALLLLALIPGQATALPLPGPADLLNAGKLVPSLDPSGWVVDGFKAIIRFIFGDSIDEIGKNLVNLLLAVPILTDAKAFPRLNEYRVYVTGGAWGLLSLSFVVAVFRYWLSSYTDSGGYEGAMGFVRGSMAICMLLVFVPFFDQLARLVNSFTAALVANKLVGESLEKGLLATMSDQALTGGGVAMILAIGAVCLAIVLLVVKVIVLALLAVLFVAMPLAISLWPIEELSWMFRSTLQAMMALYIFPVVWALCFGTFAVLNVDALFPGEHGATIDKLLAPLLVFAALVIMVRLPFRFLAMAGQVGISPGISRGVGHAQTVVRMVPTGRFSSPTSRMKG